jgi:hypothetical protein
MVAYSSGKSGESEEQGMKGKGYWICVGSKEEIFNYIVVIVTHPHEYNKTHSLYTLNG